MLTLLVQTLFTLLCVGACVSYLRTRDPLQRDVTWVFSAVGCVLLISFIVNFLGQPPWIRTGEPVGA